jgi:hypothetical protein
MPDQADRIRMQNIFRTPVGACPICRGPSCDAPVTLFVGKTTVLAISHPGNAAAWCVSGFAPDSCFEDN